jgi:HD superfamily phosphohydrolase
MAKPRRIRDPIHDLIEFSKDDLDQLAWAALNSPEFQRLRRIKQLGFSELVFPGATHSRLAHSIGVFHTARQLSRLISSRLGKDFDPDRSTIAQAAALVHDLGHGPFSHSFEDALKKLGIKKRHEEWTVEIITGDTHVSDILSKFSNGFHPRMRVEEVLRLLGSRRSFRDRIEPARAEVLHVVERDHRLRLPASSSVHITAQAAE